jgi:hypothetical protein
MLKEVSETALIFGFMECTGRDDEAEGRAAARLGIMA